MSECVCECGVLVFLGEVDRRALALVRGERLADVHPILLSLQIFVVSLVLVLVLSLAVVWRGMQRVGGRGRHRGRTGVTETRGLYGATFKTIRTWKLTAETSGTIKAAWTFTK